MSWQTFTLSIEDKIGHLQFNRPEALNTLVPELWSELPRAVRQLDDAGTVRALIISSTGKHFTAGMDLSAFAALAPERTRGEGRARSEIMEVVRRLQDSFTCLEQARFPVIAAVHGGCIGGGVDLVTACDLRFATTDAFFSVHEINLAMTADVGTFPRLQKLIPEGIAREMAFTGERLHAHRAAAIGLVNCVLDDRGGLLDYANGIARKIASKSPLAVWGSKQMLNFGRDHSTADSLNHIATWQSGMLDLDDVQRAVAVQRSGEPHDHEDLAPRRGLGDEG